MKKAFLPALILLLAAIGCQSFDNQPSAGNELPVASKTVSMDGEWRLSCRNDLTLLDITGNEAYLSLNSNNAIYINVYLDKVEGKDNEFQLRFKNLDSQQNYYEDQPTVTESAIATDKAIGKLIFQSEDELILEWYGLFDLQQNKRTFVENFLFLKENGGQSPIVVHRCGSGGK